jgi:hypothetical protein
MIQSEFGLETKPIEMIYVNIRIAVSETRIIEKEHFMKRLQCYVMLC